MSFTTRSTTFSTNYPSLGSIQLPSCATQSVSSPASIYADARVSGSQISVSCSTSFQGGLGVRNLETANWRLKSKNWEHLEKKGCQVSNWGRYFKTIKKLMAQIFANSVDNACIVLQTDNAHLADDDFRVKYETEMAMCQSVESDIHGLWKVTDDTYVTGICVTEDRDRDFQGGPALHEEEP
ncbi:hypothetical protein P7K49_003033 [Saguinus oedipus]|uniref:IF rod domain-containing protein n=1 Tax=Saguinus oedipus TaxID=9490 RepID=A0ABQ9WJ10_SAGOE|nr:hypothetical protein P7K49_003033 [Saguinus oedipus]